MPYRAISCGLGVSFGKICQRNDGVSLLVQLLSLSLKIAIASLITGMSMSYFNITIESFLDKFGFTKTEFIAWMMQAVEWMMPNIILGSFIIIPIWVVILLLTPSSGNRQE